MVGSRWSRWIDAVGRGRTGERWESANAFLERVVDFVCGVHACTVETMHHTVTSPIGVEEKLVPLHGWGCGGGADCN